MRSIWKTIIRINALGLCLALLCLPAGASELFTSFSVGMISVKTTVLNPLLALERDFQSLHSLIYEGLVTLDDNYEPQPNVALRWTASNDCKTWTFTLRDDVYFSDGTQLTAYDVAATAQEILRLAKDDTAENKGVYAADRYVFTKAVVNDAQTVVFTSARPYYGFIYGMTFPILKADEVRTDYPVGSGPYKAVWFEPGNSLLLSLNEYWWQDEPNVTEINAIFSANQVDAILTRSVTAAQYRGGVNSVNLDFRTRQLETLLLNTKSYELEDIRVRYAIRYAIDPDALANGAYYGMVSRTDTPFPRGTWMYYDASDADGQDYYSVNLAKAEQLLYEAGWEDSDGDNILDRVRNGKKENLSLRLWVYEEAENSVRVEVANQIKDMLARVKIAVRIDNISYGLAKERLNAGNFDLALAAFQMDAVPDPGFLLYGPNTGNYGGYRTEEMNGLIDALRKSTSQYEYQQNLYQIQAVFARDCPFICLYYRGGAVLTRKIFTNTRDVREPEVL